MEPARAPPGAGPPAAAAPSGPALRYVLEPRPGDPAGDDGRGRDAGLQLPGHPPAPGAVQLRRRGGTYTALAVAMAAGSVVGALAAPRGTRRARACWLPSAFGFGAVALIPRLRPTLPLELVACSARRRERHLRGGHQLSLRLAADPAMRGRMALYSIVFLGSTPIGGPISWLGEAIDRERPRARRGRGTHGRARSPRRPGRRAASAPDRTGEGVRAPHRRRWRGWPAGMRSRPSPVSQRARWAEGRGRLDVEADPVALLDRADRPLAVTPRERVEDRVARAHGGHRGKHPPEPPHDHRERPDRPQPRKAIRPGLSVGNEVAVRAEANARDIASPARDEVPRTAPEEDCDVHQAPANISVAVPPSWPARSRSRPQRGRRGPDQQHGDP